MGYGLSITTSGDTEELRDGDAVYAIFADGTEVKGRIVEVEAEGDVDDEGYAYGWTVASAILDDGREFWMDMHGMGQLNSQGPPREQFETQARPMSFYAPASDLLSA